MKETNANVEVLKKEMMTKDKEIEELKTRLFLAGERIPTR